MQQGVKYNVDIVFCVDATSSMRDLIEMVKGNVLRFNEDLQKAMEEEGKVIDSLRVKVIGFRDYYFDGEKAMQESKFFSLPQEKEEFANFVNPIRAEGGGDIPENSLEALVLAMNSDWSTGGDKRRQVIVMC